MSGETYQSVALVVGIIGFIAIWIYAMSEWGFLVGLAIGWFPAIIGGVAIGFLWPLVAIIVIWLLLNG